MSTIKIITLIDAPVNVCFDLSRNIDLHTESMKHTHEKAVAGTTSGLIGLGDDVTWQANHFGIAMKMTVRITEMQFPDHFTDEMIKGPFKSIKHYHGFQYADGQTIMTDEFTFRLPFGFIGVIVDKLLMQNYMRRLLTRRNQQIKQAAETAAGQTKI